MIGSLIWYQMCNCNLHNFEEIFNLQFSKMSWIPGFLFLDLHMWHVYCDYLPHITFRFYSKDLQFSADFPSQFYVLFFYRKLNQRYSKINFSRKYWKKKKKRKKKKEQKLVDLSSQNKRLNLFFHSNWKQFRVFKIAKFEFTVTVHYGPWAKYTLLWALEGALDKYNIYLVILKSIEDFKLNQYPHFQLILPMRFHFVKYFVNSIIARVSHKLLYCAFIEVHFEKKKMLEIFIFLQK